MSEGGREGRQTVNLGDTLEPPVTGGLWRLRFTGEAGQEGGGRAGGHVMVVVVVCGLWSLYCVVLYDGIGIGL